MHTLATSHGAAQTDSQECAKFPNTRNGIQTFRNCHFEGTRNTQILFLMAQNIYLETLFLSFFPQISIPKLFLVKSTPKRQTGVLRSLLLLEHATGRETVTDKWLIKA